jgi:amidophosphoribosyltransferase
MNKINDGPKRPCFFGAWGGLFMGGTFGIVSKKDCVSDLFYGTDYHSHLGTKRGGLATQNFKGFSRSIHNIENNYFRSKFESDLPKLEGLMGIGGKINNIHEIAEKAFQKKIHFYENSSGELSPTELVATLICEKGSFEDGIRNVQETIKGSCSMLILTEEGIYAARDKLGRTPLVVGRKAGAYAVSSETCAFPNLDFEIDRYLGPGEIVFLTADGYEQRFKPMQEMQICSFLWVYYGYPASSYEGINVELVRNRCGAALGREDDVEIDYVAGIPDSGTGHAIGYANKRNIPYLRPFVKYTPTWPRSFMPQDQNTRDLVAKMKLIPNKTLIEGKRILFCEDSIVRGTQLQDNIQILFDVGALEVHMRPACPTLIYPCEFLNFSTSRSTLDLAGRKAIKELEGAEDKLLEQYAVASTEKNRQMIDRIALRLRLTSLKYQKLDNLVEAIGLPKEKLCTHCWDGSSYF